MLPFHDVGGDVSYPVAVSDHPLQDVRVQLQLLAVEVHGLLVDLGLALVDGEVVLHRQQVGGEDDGSILYAISLD